MRNPHLQFLPRATLEKIQGTPEWQEKRDENMRASTISNLNNRFHEVVELLYHDLKENASFLGLLRQSRIVLRGTEILRIRGRQQMESLPILKEQVALIIAAVPLLPKESFKRNLCKSMVNNLRGQLSSLDQELSTKVNRFLQTA